MIRLITLTVFDRFDEPVVVHIEGGFLLQLSESILVAGVLICLAQLQLQRFKDMLECGNIAYIVLFRDRAVGL